MYSVHTGAISRKAYPKMAHMFTGAHLVDVQLDRAYVGVPDFRVLLPEPGAHFHLDCNELTEQILHEY